MDASVKRKIFISYSHKDQEWFQLVRIHLKVLEYYPSEDSNFEIWDDKRIRTGDRWKEDIDKALGDSTAAILLISADYLASEFIRDNELQPLLNKAQTLGTLILPLVLSPCGFLRVKTLSVFQAVNDPKTEVLSTLTKSKQEEIIEKLVDDVSNHIEG